MPAQPDLRATYCEEFEAAAVAIAPVVLAAASEPATRASVLHGLCGNCLNRETCQLASSEGGIWHCEEYQ